MIVSLVWSPWTLALAAGALGYVAYDQHQKLVASQQVAYAAQQSAAALQDRINAMAETASATSVTDKAKAWWDSFAANASVDDLKNFLSQLDSKWVPLVLQQWKTDGLSLAFLMDLAKDFGIIS
ncbi:MAG TPA: hypothetical protein VGM94_00645 [Galbitalea sp.]